MKLIFPKINKSPFIPTFISFQDSHKQTHPESLWPHPCKQSPGGMFGPRTVCPHGLGLCVPKQYSQKQVLRHWLPDLTWLCIASYITQKVNFFKVTGKAHDIYPRGEREGGKYQVSNGMRYKVDRSAPVSKCQVFPMNTSVIQLPSLVV